MQVTPLICAFALLSAVLTSCTAIRTVPRVAVNEGALIGTTADGVYSFKGVPYAAPPVGDLRWRSPQPPVEWAGDRDAGSYAPHCAQPDTNTMNFNQYPMSEDCLTVNVWTPDIDSDAALPVMVWIHGGGFSVGSGNVPRTNSAAMAAQGVVLVTINYRLSVFGFIAHPALTAAHPDEVATNFGVQDAVAALRWVKENVAAFGGDPGNITVFGESAGANMVNTLLVVPAAEGLFNRAIAQSASTGLAPDAYPDKRAGFLPPAYKAGEKFAESLGVSSQGKSGRGNAEAIVKQLRALSTEEILAVITDQERFTPVIDGTVLPDHVGILFREGKHHRVDYLFGSNSWEASLGRQIGGGFSPEFSARLLTAEQKQNFYPGLQGAQLEDAIFGDLIVHSGNDYVGRHMAAAEVPVFRYYFSYQASDRRDRQPGVAHADDIAFVMQTLDTEGDITAINQRDREVSELMSRYWVEFARSGDPNFPGAPSWGRFSGNAPRVLEIGDEVGMRDSLFADRLQLHVQRGQDMLDRASR